MEQAAIVTTIPDLTVTMDADGLKGDVYMSTVEMFDRVEVKGFVN